MRIHPSVLPALAVTAAAALVGALCQSTSAGAATAAPRPSAYRFLLTFDHRESLKSGTRVVDASGHKHGGVVLVAGGGKLRPAEGWVRRAAQFPGHGRAIVQIADHKGLDPQRRPFVFGAAVRVKHSMVEFGANLVQKGYYNQDGGQWKLQLGPGGVPNCVVFGAASRVKAVATRSIANGRWHRLSCMRTPAGVTLRVDGKTAASVAGLTGRIANTAPVKIGGKKINPGNKQFHGRVDSVFLRLLTRP